MSEENKAMVSRLVEAIRAFAVGTAFARTARSP
jgi:hypothetical protein